ARRRREYRVSGDRLRSERPGARFRLGIARRACVGRTVARAIPAPTFLITFDKRGTGMSDRVSFDRLPTLEERSDDLRAVMDAARSGRGALFGFSEGGNLASLFAAAHPSRTAALVLFGCFAKRLRSPDYPWAPTAEERAQEYIEIERTWGDMMD